MPAIQAKINYGEATLREIYARQVARLRKASIRSHMKREFALRLIYLKYIFKLRKITYMLTVRQGPWTPLEIEMADEVRLYFAKRWIPDLEPGSDLVELLCDLLCW